MASFAHVSTDTHSAARLASSHRGSISTLLRLTLRNTWITPLFFLSLRVNARVISPVTSPKFSAIFARLKGWFNITSAGVGYPLHFLPASEPRILLRRPRLLAACSISCHGLFLRRCFTIYCVPHLGWWFSLHIGPLFPFSSSQSFMAGNGGEEAGHHAISGCGFNFHSLHASLLHTTHSPTNLGDT